MAGFFFLSIGDTCGQSWSMLCVDGKLIGGERKPAKTDGEMTAEDDVSMSGG